MGIKGGLDTGRIYCERRLSRSVPEVLTCSISKPGSKTDSLVKGARADSSRLQPQRVNENW